MVALKLRDGGTYLTRDGKKKITVVGRKDGFYPFRDKMGGYFYTEAGAVYLDDRDNPNNLVREDLRLRVGGRYMRRDGLEVEIVSFNEGLGFPFLTCGGTSYRTDGVFSDGSNHTSGPDLIYEIVDETKAIPIEDKEEYFVYRKGGGTPKRMHTTLEKATAEAKRLASREEGTYFVVKAVKKIKSSLTVTEE